MRNYWKQTLERRLNRRSLLSLIAAAGATGVLAACSSDESPSNEGGASVAVQGRPAGWAETTHGNVDADFATVFPNNRVNQIKLTIDEDDWQEMLDDMTALFGARGSGGFGAPGGMQGQMPQGGQFQPGQQQVPPGGGGGADMGVARTKKPMWVAGKVTFNGVTWTNVGIRFKGNSSLRQSWGTGSDRLPFKLDFDEWEEAHPEVNNQRFYGFKQLSLSNNVGDPTHMRETLAYDVFEEAGLPAAHTAFYEVILDRGEGETNLGVYTVIEVVDDTLLERVFGEGQGNVYEAEGSAASLASGVAANIKNSFQKENNEAAADWSDVEKLHSVLHSTKRVSDLAGWQKDLEAVFDVPAFLEFLAIAAVLQHWDTYGAMPHNFYLYNHDGKLTWISWDHNFILGAMGGGGGGGGANQQAGNNQRQGGFNRSVSLGRTEVSAAQWPLIRYLLDVPGYYEAYRKYLEQTVNGPFAASKMQAKYEAWATVLKGPADRQNGNTSVFQAAVQSLIQTTKDRNKAVEDFLAG